MSHKWNSWSILGFLATLCQNQVFSALAGTLSLPACGMQRWCTAASAGPHLFHLFGCSDAPHLIYFDNEGDCISNLSEMMSKWDASWEPVSHCSWRSCGPEGLNHFKDVVYRRSFRWLQHPRDGWRMLKVLLRRSKLILCSKFWGMVRKPTCSSASCQHPMRRRGLLWRLQSFSCCSEEHVCNNTDIN